VPKARGPSGANSGQSYQVDRCLCRLRSSHRMHRGRKVTEKRTTETNTQELVQYMVGALDDTRVQ